MNLSFFKNPPQGFIIGGIILALGFFSFVSYYFWRDGVFESETYQIEKLTAAIIPESSTVFDRTGEKIGEFYNEYHVPLTYQEIPKPMINSLLAIEDRKFFEHEGVHWRSLIRASLNVMLSGKFSQGGSTLTMQLVKNYLLTREKKVSRKIRELILSYYVEKNLSKERILELYLNTMYLGHGAYGVGAAALVYFGKPLNQLNPAETALLAGLFQAPSSYDPHKNPQAALKRKNIVLDAMVAAEMLSKEESEALKALKLTFVPWTPVNETIAPHFIEWIRGEVFKALGEEGDESSITVQGYKIYTTLDRNYQRIANESVASHLDLLNQLEQQLNKSRSQKKKERIECALVATDPHTGAILAMVGGKDYRSSQYNRATQARRSPGSSFKPVVYSLALDHGMIWSNLVYVSPIDIGGFRPKNHDGEDLTEVTLAKALAKSMNTPVVSLTQKYGIKDVIDRAHLMGVQARIPNEIGAAIGGFSASILDIDSIYRTIANEGQRFEAFGISKIEDRQGKLIFEFSTNQNPPIEAISKSTAHLLRSGLQIVLAQGTGSSLSSLSGYAAGKTGTSDDSRDNWFAGFTKNISLTVWVGGDQHTSLGKQASGAALALPIWGSFIQKSVASGLLSSESWSNPDDLSPATFDPDSGAATSSGFTALFPKDRSPGDSTGADDMKALRQQNGNYRELKLGD